ncbi:SusC/RagA family TonB-linked outer membrane protein [Flavobacterium sp. 20NA77.7]|uniref:SusC/RagA family TonB-linked outer membrane protein n=1 Tax=Flavobacterium nakdongensis TaxID=3073563 RepID=A0ABY9RBH3_9FLAO|nr:SusC/RagA family TonB-linked outer membrane protein [Flavobacterium sp. 20NA77.7]WMW78316.1 SusC/RagA family TonB-linked outer membrane protein [Flavobacterium sp. 20NA77.7]
MRSKFKWIFTLLVAFTMQFSFAQQKTVTGTVSSEGVALPGASVKVKGTQQGTTTDGAGKYSIKAKEGDVLVVTFVGKPEQSATVGASNLINFTLSGDTTIEVVKIEGALGIKKRKDAITSTQQQIGNKELTQAVNPNAIQALTGKVSGLQINASTNGVNKESRIVLRGNRSLTGDNQALIVIDNAISNATVLSQLPPDIIENVNVIKGAQGSALYGAQGVNGVIIVTTKKGSKKEKFTFGVTSAVDFESVNFVPQRQNKYGQGWITDTNFDGSASGIPAGNGFVPFENGAWGPAFSDPTMPSMVPVGLPQANGQFLMTPWAPIKDNVKQFFNTGVTYQNGFNFNFGGADSYAFLSVNRLNQDFVVKGDKLTRNSFLFKAGKKIGKFNIDGNVNYISSTSSETDADLYYDLLQTASNIPVGQLNSGLNEHNWTVYYKSPYWKRNAIRNDYNNNFLNGIVALGYEFNKNISVNYTANLQLRTTESQSHNDGFTNIGYEYNFGSYTYGGTNVLTYEDMGGSPVTSNFYANQSTTRNFYGDLLVNFDYDLTKDINFKANIGNNVQDRYFRVMTQGGTNLDIPGFYHINNVLNQDLASALDNRMVRSRVVAGFANVDLSYKDYLFLNATGRVEQSSVIKNSFFYPSVGVSFIPTKAIAALKDNKVLNYAKLSASYTSVGNASAVAAYAINPVATPATNYPFGTLNSLAYNAFPTDPNIKPEFVNTKEISAQLGFFNDRITLEGSYYVADTKDLITNITASRASGLSTLRGNAGDLQNKGFEIDLGVTPVKTNSFKWDMRASYTHYKTVVKALAAGVDEVNLQSNTFVGVFATVGEEFPLIKGTAFVRDANGNVVVDGNGLPQRTSAFQKLGKATPDYIIGFTNSFEYKGFKLTAVADFRTGHSIYSETKRNLTWSGHLVDSAENDRYTGYVFPGVTSTGAVNTTPVNGGGYAGTLNFFSGVYDRVGEAQVIDATALKIRELSLSYSLPKKMIEKTGLTSLRVGVNARNPFVFLADGKFIKPTHGGANLGYTDPEANNLSTGNNYSTSQSSALGIANIGQYPTTRTLGFSVNLTF